MKPRHALWYLVIDGKNQPYTTAVLSRQRTSRKNLVGACSRVTGTTCRLIAVAAMTSYQAFCKAHTMGDNVFYLWYDGLGFGHCDDCASSHATLDEAIAAAKAGYQSRQKVTTDPQGENVVWSNY